MRQWVTTDFNQHKVRGALAPPQHGQRLTRCRLDGSIGLISHGEAYTKRKREKEAEAAVQAEKRRKLDGEKPVKELLQQLRFIEMTEKAKLNVAPLKAFCQHNCLQMPKKPNRDKLIALISLNVGLRLGCWASKHEEPLVSPPVGAKMLEETQTSVAPPRHSRASRRRTAHDDDDTDGEEADDDAPESETNDDDEGDASVLDEDVWTTTAQLGRQGSRGAEIVDGELTVGISSRQPEYRIVRHA